MHRLQHALPETHESSTLGTDSLSYAIIFNNFNYARLTPISVYGFVKS